MARYIALLEGVSVSTLKTLIEFTAPSDEGVELIEAWITQDASESSTQEVAQVTRKSAAGTGTSFTARLLSPNGDASFGGSVRTDCTAEGTLADILIREGFNILNGWFHKPVPESRIIVPPSGILALRYGATPAAALTTSAGMMFETRG